jgi:hypothetical protein
MSRALFWSDTAITWTVNPMLWAAASDPSTRATTATAATTERRAPAPPP